MAASAIMTISALREIGKRPGADARWDLTASLFLTT
jgi:hypothetical protein